DSGISLVEQRLDELSEKDLERQLWIVHASMATLASHTDGPNFLAPHPATSSSKVVAPAELMTAAAQIGDRLAELAIATDDEAIWLGLGIAGETNWCLSPLGSDLYDGLPGVVLFLAYLGRLTGNRSYTTLAKAGLKALRRQTQLQTRGSIGAFAGSAGIIYLL